MEKVGTDKLTYLLDEYKYRHNLIWRTLITITLAVVILSYLPYVDYVRGFRQSGFGSLLLFLPLLAVFIAMFGCRVMEYELSLFWRIVLAYHYLQNQFIKDTYHDRPDVKPFELPEIKQEVKDRQEKEHDQDKDDSRAKKDNQVENDKQEKPGKDDSFFKSVRFYLKVLLSLSVVNIIAASLWIVLCIVTLQKIKEVIDIGIHAVKAGFGIT